MNMPRSFSFMCVRDIEIDAVSMSRSVVYKVYYIILWTYLYI